MGDHFPEKNQGFRLRLQPNPRIVFAIYRTTSSLDIPCSLLDILDSPSRIHLKTPAPA